MSIISISIGIAQAASAPAVVVTPYPIGFREDLAATFRKSEKTFTTPEVAQGYAEIEFRHGDVSWLAPLASEAGWPKKTHAELARIILRESGGCPNRKGGDMVDKKCNITGVSEWNHRSDTGLLQINGVNYNLKRNKWARVCLDMGVCTQEPLLDALTNLKAGYVLYQYAGFDPWDPCAWGPEFADRCENND